MWEKRHQYSKDSTIEVIIRVAFVFITIFRPVHSSVFFRCTLERKRWIAFFREKRCRVQNYKKTISVERNAHSNTSHINDSILSISGTYFTRNALQSPLLIKEHQSVLKSIFTWLTYLFNRLMSDTFLNFLTFQQCSLLFEIQPRDDKMRFSLFRWHAIPEISTFPFNMIFYILWVWL